MSILKALQEFLLTYDGMILQKVGENEKGTTIDGINTDFPEECPGNYAIAAAGNSKTSKDILGNTKYSSDYVFYAKSALCDEVDRQDNHTFLEGFSAWIDEQNSKQRFPTMPACYTAEEISVSNGLLLDTDEDFMTGIYQVQIKLNYKKIV